MSVVYVNLGSNLGDKKALINKAIELIGEQFGFYCISEFVESEPWGFISTNSFLNVGVAFKSDLEPEEILYSLQQIEKKLSASAHRDAKGNYIDRNLDIDIMAIDNIVYKSSILQLPHPHLFERPFFLNPLKQLCPDWDYTT